MWIGRRILDDFKAEMTALIDDSVGGFHADAVRAREAAERQVVELQKQLAIQGAIVSELRATIASNKTTIDFLTRDVNTLNLERATLLSKLTGISMPNVEITRAPTGEPLNVPALEELVDSLPAFREKDEQKKPGMAETAAGGALFEDMGDEEARRQGIELGAMNEAIY